MKKLVSFLFGVMMLSLLAACEDSEIREVKNLSLPYCDSYTIAELMDSVMLDQSWYVIMADSGLTMILTRGTIVDGEQEFRAEFLFDRISGKYAEMLSFKRNGRSTPLLVAHKYFARYCSDDYLTYIETGVVSAVKSSVETAKAVADGVREAYKENEQDLNNFSDKVINVTGKALNKALDKIDESLDEEE